MLRKSSAVAATAAETATETVADNRRCKEMKKIVCATGFYAQGFITKPFIKIITKVDHKLIKLNVTMSNNSKQI